MVPAINLILCVKILTLILGVSLMTSAISVSINPVIRRKKFSVLAVI